MMPSVDDAVAQLFPSAELFPSMQVQATSDIADEGSFAMSSAETDAVFDHCHQTTGNPLIHTETNKQDSTNFPSGINSVNPQAEGNEFVGSCVVNSDCFDVPNVPGHLQPARDHFAFFQGELTTNQVSLGADQCQQFAISPQVVTKQGSSSSESTRTMKRRARAWTSEEHTRFLKALDKLRTDKTEGIDKNGKQTTGLGPGIADTIAAFVQTRNAAQVRSHAQKHFQRLRRERENT